MKFFLKKKKKDYYMLHYRIISILVIKTNAEKKFITTLYRINKITVYFLTEFK